MKIEQLKRGKEIERRIEFLSEQKEAINLISPKTYKVIFELPTGGCRVIKAEFFDIDLCKTLLLSKVNKEIQELETEFENI